MRHLVSRSSLITAALALIGFAPGAVSPALAQCLSPGPACGEGIGPCHCGDTVLTSTKLNGSDPVLNAACPRDGLFVTAGVKLTIGGAVRAAAGNACSGIVVLPEATDVTVTTGKIIGFLTGLDAFSFEGGVTNSTFSRLQIEGGEVCLFVTGDDNAIESNRVTGCEFRGMDIRGDRNRLSLNRAEDSGLGFSTLGTGNVVSRNVALRNQGDGFAIAGAEAAVESNQAKHNGLEGFFIEGFGHHATLNIAESNTNGFRNTFSSFSVYSRNRSNYNTALGIIDQGILFNDNVYSANLCTGNGAGNSEPSGLCR